MIRYILECMAFQMLFLAIYDLFLKKETFFQWNRCYLILTFLLALILPKVEVGAFRTTVPNGFAPYPEYLWGRGMDMEAVTVQEGWVSNLGWPEMIFSFGMVVSAFLFGFKLFQIYRLRVEGELQHFPKFTRIVLERSNVAFSFFRNLFVGDEVLKKEHSGIIEHELVHMEQGHSWDLLLFELAKIMMWFNPLVYLYQLRISDVHEFIADAKVTKTNKKEQYELLLSQIFDTPHISFLNQFSRSSMIKKRIIMLRTSRSKKICQLKYLFLVPLVVGLLFYTSCEMEGVVTDQGEVPLEGLNASTEGGNVESLSFQIVDEVPVFPGCADATDKRACFNEKMLEHIRKNFRYPEEAQAKGIQGRVSLIFTIGSDGTVQNIRKRGPDPLLEAEGARIVSRLPQMEPGKNDGVAVAVSYSIPITFRISGESISTVSDKSTGSGVPISEVDEMPVFPGCADATDKRACFNEKIQEHIRKNFRYPLMAQKKEIEGRVDVIFTIASDGAIENIRKRGPDPLLEAEVERIISRLPQMEPGKKDGVKVAVPYSIPVDFVL
ncbi:MAG: M56 family metallopeptidase [Sediminicola sp.]